MTSGKSLRMMQSLVASGALHENPTLTSHVADRHPASFSIFHFTSSPLVESVSAQGRHSVTYVMHKVALQTGSQSSFLTVSMNERRLYFWASLTWRRCYMFSSFVFCMLGHCQRPSRLIETSWSKLNRRNLGETASKHIEAAKERKKIENVDSLELVVLFLVIVQLIPFPPRNEQATKYVVLYFFKF